MSERTKYLLVCLMEECAELQQAAAKCIRFGLENSWENEPTNVEKLITEFADLTAVFAMIGEKTILPEPDWDTMVQLKQQKIERFMNI